MSKNTIKIDGAKVKEALEVTTGKTVYQIAKDNGFSDNFLKQACKANRASPIVQSVMRSYGLEPEDFKLKEEPETDYKQMSLEDMQSERMVKAIQASNTALIRLSAQVTKTGESLRSAFEDLVNAWNRAIEEYNETINKLQEGK